MAPTGQARRRAQRRRRVRRTVVVGTVFVLAAGAAGTAMAMQNSDGPQYRLATVTRSTVNQTVDGVGTLTPKREVDAAFAVAGTVQGVNVAVGSHVTAGQTLATLDHSALDTAVAAAKTTLAQAEEQLADAEDGISNSTSATTPTNGTSATGQTGSTTTSTVALSSATTSTGATTAESAGDIVLTAARSSSTSTATSTSTSTATSAPTSTAASISALQAKVKTAAAALAQALTTELDTIGSACTATEEKTGSTTRAAADASGTISGTLGTEPAYVTLQDASGNTVARYGDGAEVPAGGSWSFDSLIAGQSYTVLVQRVVVDADQCAAALTTAKSASSEVAAALHSLDAAVAALAQAAGTSSSGTGGSGASRGSGVSGGTSGPTSGGTTSTKPSGTAGGSSGSSGSSGSTRSGGAGGTSGTGGSSGAGGTSGTSATGGTSGSTGTTGSTTTTVTAEQIAVDVAQVAQAKADLKVARQQRVATVLTSPVSGTVATVAIAKGDSVSANSSSSTITVVSTGAMSITVPVSLAKIDLVKVGQSAHVTVNGRSEPLPAKVVYVGVLNSSSSTGSSSTYPVTVQLTQAATGVYDGMSAEVAIDVGRATGALVIPLSALHTTGTRTTVEVYRDGKAVPTSVTLGVVGDVSAQVSKGLSAGEQVVLADTSAAVPSSTSTNTRRGSGGTFSGLTGGSGGTVRVGPGAGGPPGGN